MTSLSLLLKNLLHFRAVNVAVIVGMAVATAVLTGALMVGDSVRGSLRTLALQRLGPVDDALISPGFFDQTLADRLHIDPAAASFDLTPALIVRGGASNDAAQSKTADVQIAALGTPRGNGPISAAWFTVPVGKCIINGELADALNITAAGQSIVLDVPTDSDLPHDSALARRGRADLLNGLRLDVAEIVRDRNLISLFNPNGGQRVPRNAWVNLADLQDATDQPDRVNALLAQSHDRGASAAALNDAITRDVQLGDYGLIIKPAVGGEVLSITSRQTYIPPAVVQTAEQVAGRQAIDLQKISVSLIDSFGVEDKFGPSVVLHYLVAAGVSTLEGQTLGARDVAVNQWVADQLGLKVGQEVPLDFYTRGPEGNLEKASKLFPPEKLSFKVARILPMSGIGADPDLPPDYKGLTDADSVADWNPPDELPINKKLVTKADEAYWKKYRAAPKLFFSFQTAQDLWGSPAARVTTTGKDSANPAAAVESPSPRLVGAQVTGLRVPAASGDAFLKSLRDQLSHAAMGLAFGPIKQQQLAAANGGTDFSEYFLYFSFFLIVAAVLLVAMLFRLGIEQRARQLGLMGAIGFSPNAVRTLALGEGGALALLGALLGLVGALAYTWLIMAGLRTWWFDAVGTTALRLHVQPLTLIIGFVSGVVVAFLAVLWSVWRLGKLAPASLLSGSWDSQPLRSRDSGRTLRWIGILGIIGGGAILGASGLKIMPTDVAFLAGGGSLLCSALVFLAGWLRPRRFAAAKRSASTPVMTPVTTRARAATDAAPGFIGEGSIYRLGIRNAGRHTARSVLAIGLVAFAVFTLIVVAVMRQSSSGGEDSSRKNGTGHYALIVQTQIPIYSNLNTIKGRTVAGFREPNGFMWDGVHVTQLRRWAGQDISCLNLTRPTSPTILSVPEQLVRRDLFPFASVLSSSASSTSNAINNPWTLLDSDQGGDVPVIADDDTAQYVLNLPVGGTLRLPDQFGHPTRLRLVATLAHSIFQSELLMSDKNFQKLFPSVTGDNVLLVDAWPSNVERMRQMMGNDLAEFSATVETPTARLAGYQAVVNTYLSTFQTLGSFGLLLGTIGLAVILVRTVIERKSELALLACLGFNSADRVRLVLAENVFLLLLGLFVGSAAAIVGVLPAIIASGRSLNVSNLLLTLLAVVIVALVSSALAVAATGIHVTPADLRRE